MVHIISDRNLGELGSEVHIITDEQLEYGVPAGLAGRLLITLTDFMAWRMRNGGVVAEVPKLDVVYFTAKGSLEPLSQWATSSSETRNLRRVLRQVSEDADVNPRPPGTNALLRLLLADHVSRTFGVRRVNLYTHRYSKSPTHLLRSALAHVSQRTGAPYASHKINLRPLIRSGLDSVRVKSGSSQMAWPVPATSQTGLTVWDTNRVTRACPSELATTFLLTPPVELELAKHIVWPPLGGTAPWSRSLRDVKARIAKKDGFAQLAELRAPVLSYLVQANWVRHHGPREYMDQLVLATCLTGIEAKPLHGLCTDDGGLSREAEFSGVSLH